MKILNDNMQTDSTKETIQFKSNNGSVVSKTVDHRQNILKEAMIQKLVNKNQDKNIFTNLGQTTENKEFSLEDLHKC